MRSIRSADGTLPAPRAAPPDECHGSPSHPLSYDRLDWHADSAIEAGQPPENAFTHIGLFLAWLIRHDLHDAHSFPAAHIAALKAGEMTGSDLADDVDGKLVAAIMAPEGQAFSDARYAAYTTAFESEFGTEEPYSVADDEAARARIEPAIDRLYDDWVAAGRPQTELDSKSPTSRSDERPMPDEFAMRQMQESMDRIATELAAAGIQPPPRPHATTDLESLIPADLTDPPMELTSVTGVAWGSSLLRRSLKRLDVRPADTFVVNGMGGSGEETLVVILFSVPGIEAERLLAEFRTVIFLPRGAWQTRPVAGREVAWMTIPEFSTAFWAKDGLVVQVSGRADVVEAAITRLP